MTRIALFSAALTAVLSAASLRADVEVAPTPRPKGVPFVPPEPAKKENPLETVDRIIKNSKAVGDKLAMTDTGAETRGTQATILKDIDQLLKPDDPPPMGGGGGESQDKDKSDQKKDMQEPMGGMPMGGMGGGGGGGDQQPKGGRKPRQGEKGKGEDKTQLPEGQEPKGKDMGTPGGGKDGKTDPMPGGMDPKNPMGGMPGGNEGTPNGPTKPALPITDDVVKDVWGHLPDQLRKQVTQYYREEFMPRYSELLKQYYSSLAEKNAKPGEPKK